MPSHNSIPISTIRAFLSGCQRRGVAPADVLEDIGLEPDLLDGDRGDFPTAKMGELVAATSLALHDETLGFLRRRTDIGGLEMSLHAIISSRNLQEGLERFLRFWSILHDECEASIGVTGEEVHIGLHFDTDGEVDRSAFITWITFVTLRIASWLIDKPLLLDRIYFNFDEPQDLDDYRDMFPTAHYFNHSANIAVFNQRFLDMPVVQTPEQVPDFARILPHLMTVRRVDSSLTGQIRRKLQGTDNIDALPLKVIAEQLHMTPVTIRRHLKREGSSFKEIKESVRRDLAIYQLERTDQPVKHIAYELGFSEPSAFNRAFKNWTGMTPGEYRRSSR